MERGTTTSSTISSLHCLVHRLVESKNRPFHRITDDHPMRIRCPFSTIIVFVAFVMVLVSSGRAFTRQNTIVTWKRGEKFDHRSSLERTLAVGRNEETEASEEGISKKKKKLRDSTPRSIESIGTKAEAFILLLFFFFFPLSLSLSLPLSLSLLLLPRLYFASRDRIAKTKLRVP